MWDRSMAKSMQWLVSEANLSVAPAPMESASGVNFKMSAHADMTYDYTTYWQHQTSVQADDENAQGCMIVRHTLFEFLVPSGNASICRCHFDWHFVAWPSSCAS